MNCGNQRCWPIWLYRAFSRIGNEKVPDAKTLARLGC
jgi:hypothetical protein